jgi:hypothetical protein
MMVRALQLTTALTAAGLSFWSPGPSAGDEHKGATAAAVHRPDGLKWQDGPPSLPAGAKFAVLEGDPAKPGPFVFRVKVPDGYKVPPHTHPKAERVTVMSGTFHLGMGDTFDPSKGEALPAGHLAGRDETLRLGRGGDRRPVPRRGPLDDHLPEPGGRPAGREEVTVGTRTEGGRT